MCMSASACECVCVGALVGVCTHEFSVGNFLLEPNEPCLSSQKFMESSLKTKNSSLQKKTSSGGFNFFDDNDLNKFFFARK